MTSTRALRSRIFRNWLVLYLFIMALVKHFPPQESHPPLNLHHTRQRQATATQATAFLGPRIVCGMMEIYNSNILHHIIAVRTTDQQDLNPDNSPLRDTISALEKILVLPSTHHWSHQ